MRREALFSRCLHSLFCSAAFHVLLLTFPSCTIHRAGVGLSFSFFTFFCLKKIVPASFCKVFHSVFHEELNPARKR